MMRNQNYSLFISDILMTRILLKNGTVYTSDGPLKNGWILIENSVIAAIDNGAPPECDEVVDLGGLTVIPGFIDVHVHGAMGCDTMQATPESLHTMARFFARQGVTSFLAAVITESSPLTFKAVENIAACKGRIPDGATLLGAYLEGPYINSQAKGAHNDMYIRRANSQEYIPLFQTHAIKQITVAPEFSENLQLIKDCRAYGVVPAIGHTLATYDQAQEAIALGVSQATHTFNAMGSLHHRAPGTLGAVLTNDAVCCELIVDNVHVHPAAVQLAIRAKGVDKIVLITDAEIGAGMPVGVYDFGRSNLRVADSGVYLPNGTLAGSVLTMNKALDNCLRATGLPLEHVWPMTSYNAAKQIGVEHKKGKLSPGYDADIAVLDMKGASVALTICEGRIVYKNL